VQHLDTIRAVLEVLQYRWKIYREGLWDW